MIKRWIRRICKLFKREPQITIKYRHHWLIETNGRYMWQANIDRFYTCMWHRLNEISPHSEPETEFTLTERKSYIFKMWLKEVPTYLKMGSDLEVGFKEQVQKHLKTNYGFDPYKDGKQVDDTPTPRQLADWWTI